MHLGHGTVTPVCAVIGAAAGSMAWGAAAWVTRRLPRLDPLAFTAAVVAVFALQAFNLPVLPGVSGHLIGGLLLAYWFGALWGCGAMTLVLAVQSLLMGDGALMALGLNLLTMGVVPCLMVYPIWNRLAGKTNGLGGIAVAAWVSAVIAALVCGVALLSQAPASVIGSMVGVHAVIGVMEAALTVSLVLIARSLANAPHRSAVVAIGLCGLLIAASHGSSPWPDGLEYSLARLQIEAAGSASLVQWPLWAAALVIAGVSLIVGKSAARKEALSW